MDNNTTGSEATEPSAAAIQTIYRAAMNPDKPYFLLSGSQQRLRMLLHSATPVVGERRRVELMKLASRTLPSPQRPVAQLVLLRYAGLLNWVSQGEHPADVRLRMDAVRVYVDNLPEQETPRRWRWTPRLGMQHRCPGLHEILAGAEKLYGSLREDLTYWERNGESMEALHADRIKECWVCGKDHGAARHKHYL